jgi:hypothetical protein
VIDETVEKSDDARSASVARWNRNETACFDWRKQSLRPEGPAGAAQQDQGGAGYFRQAYSAWKARRMI